MKNVNTYNKYYLFLGRLLTVVPGIAALAKRANVSGQGNSLYCSHHRFTTKPT